MFTRNQHLQVKIFEIAYDDPVILPSNRWAVNVNFRLISINGNNVHNENIYTLVCSPQYREEPTEEYREYLNEKIIVLPFLDKSEIDNRIQATVKLLNECKYDNWDDYYKALEEYYYVDI